MDKRCLLLPPQKDHAVCGDFLARIGSVSMMELRLWLDKIEKDCAIGPTQLVGMVIWTNEHLNHNVRAADSASESNK